MRGFSLVELSIVLVILGLLAGGIVAGQSLVRAAQLRSVGTEATRYLTAVHSFRDRFFAVPGDFNKAVDFWGEAAAADCGITTTQDARTCNGNGNGLIELLAPPAIASNEYFRFWQHLANAGLIEGRYSGIQGDPGTGATQIAHAAGGVNVPLSKLTKGLWYARDMQTRNGHSELFDGIYHNSLLIGSPREGIYGQPVSALLKPEEAWNIDSKIDDGQPATGRLVPINRMDCTVFADGSTMTADAIGAAAKDAHYALANNSIVCGLIVRRITS